MPTTDPAALRKAMLSLEATGAAAPADPSFRTRYDEDFENLDYAPARALVEQELANRQVQRTPEYIQQATHLAAKQPYEASLRQDLAELGTPDGPLPAEYARAFPHIRGYSDKGFNYQNVAELPEALQKMSSAPSGFQHSYHLTKIQDGEKIREYYKSKEALLAARKAQKTKTASMYALGAEQARHTLGFSG